MRLTKPQEEELYSFFLKNFPYAVREEKKARKLLCDPTNVMLSRRDKDGHLFGACVMHRNAIYMLAVDKAYRKKGIGSALLDEAEYVLGHQGYHKATVGVGEDYLLPGVPTTMPICDKGRPQIENCEGVGSQSALFFIKRGWVHGWKDADCFDMRADLSLPFTDKQIGEKINRIIYRWATAKDKQEIKSCTEDAEPLFTTFYQDEDLYNGHRNQRVLVAEKDGEIGGVLMVGYETEKLGLGSIGCTAVKTHWRGHHVGVTLVQLGTDALRAAGLKKGFLGYTYSGLDRMYGYAGYTPCMYYLMAEKKLKRK